MGVTFFGKLSVVAETGNIQEVALASREPGFFDPHAVLGEGTGLVSEDHGHGAERLDAGQAAHEGVALCHVLHAQRGDHRGRGREAFRNGGDAQARGGEQHLVSVDAARNPDDEHTKTEHAGRDRQDPAHAMQLVLQRSLLLRLREDIAGDASIAELAPVRTAMARPRPRAIWFLEHQAVRFANGVEAGRASTTLSTGTDSPVSKASLADRANAAISRASAATMSPSSSSSTSPGTTSSVATV